MSYSKAIQYGKSFNRYYGIDYVHNIWLRYYENTGKNLFEETRSNRWLYVAIRNEFLNSIRHNNRYSDIVTEEGEEIYFRSNSIIDNIIYNELDKFMQEKIKFFFSQKLQNSNSSKDNVELALKLYELTKLGYQPRAMSKELGVEEHILYYIKSQIREAIEYMPLHNPFNGDKTSIKRMILDKTFADKEDKDDYLLHDENEYYKLYVHKESSDGLLVKITEPQGVEHYLKTLK